MILLALPVFLLAGLGILFCTIQGFRFLGMALNPRRPLAQRRMRAAMAALCLCGMFAAAAAGYLGIIALLYYGGASQTQ